MPQPSIDPLFSTGVLMAVQGGRFAANAIHQGFLAKNLTAEQFAPYQQQAIQEPICSSAWSTSSTGAEPAQAPVHSAAHETTRSAITSLLAMFTGQRCGTASCAKALPATWPTTALLHEAAAPKSSFDQAFPLHPGVRRLPHPPLQVREITSTQTPVVLIAPRPAPRLTPAAPAL